MLTPTTKFQQFNKAMVATGQRSADAKYKFTYADVELGLFVERPFVSVAEANAYLETNQRTTGITVFINTGGTLDPDTGTIAGGTNQDYQYKDGIADGDLVVKCAAGGGGGGGLAFVRVADVAAMYAYTNTAPVGTEYIHFLLKPSTSRLFIEQQTSHVGGEYREKWYFSLEAEPYDLADPGTDFDPRTLFNLQGKRTDTLSWYATNISLDPTVITIDGMLAALGVKLSEWLVRPIVDGGGGWAPADFTITIVYDGGVSRNTLLLVWADTISVTCGIEVNNFYRMFDYWATDGQDFYQEVSTRQSVINDVSEKAYEFADNAAAMAGGLGYGQKYRTGDLLKIVHA